MATCPSCNQNPNNENPLMVNECTDCGKKWCFHCDGYGTNQCPRCGHGASTPVFIQD